MRGLWAAVVALGFSVSPASAAIINLDVSGGPGLTGTSTRTCDNSFCGTVLWSLASGEQFAATGTITIDTTNNTMVISLAVASSVLDADPAPVSGGPQPAVSDGASSLVFTGGLYTSGALPVSVSAGGAGTTVYQILNNGQVGGVSFTSVVPTGAGPGAALSLGSVRVIGSCAIDADAHGTCGVTFGAAGATNFKIPGGVAFGNYDRWVQHTLNVTVVPEPGTLALLGLGLLGVAGMSGLRRH